jgi:hypothetical protein
MPFRDDREAAFARAEALERELEERDARLAAKEQELERARIELALARGEDISSLGPAAQRKLVSVDTLLDARNRARSQLTLAGPTAVETQRVDRLLHSVRPEADGVVLAWTIALVLGVAGIVGFVETGWFLGTLATLGAATMAVGSLKLDRGRRAKRVIEEFEWAATRPYELRGYPALLDVRPRGVDERAPDGHSKIILRVELASEDPVDLYPTLRELDSEIERNEDGSFSRKSPVTPNQDGAEHADHNLAVHDWVRSCAHKILDPLHHAYGLRKVEITLE